MNAFGHSDAVEGVVLLATAKHLAGDEGSDYADNTDGYADSSCTPVLASWLRISVHVAHESIPFIHVFRPLVFGCIVQTG